MLGRSWSTRSLSRKLLERISSLTRQVYICQRQSSIASWCPESDRINLSCPASDVFGYRTEFLSGFPGQNMTGHIRFSPPGFTNVLQIQVLRKHSVLEDILRTLDGEYAPVCVARTHSEPRLASPYPLMNVAVRRGTDRTGQKKLRTEVMPNPAGQNRTGQNLE